MTITFSDMIKLVRTNALTWASGKTGQVLNAGLTARDKLTVLEINKILTAKAEDYDKVRDGVIQQLGEETEDGNYKVKEENRQQFFDEMSIVHESEITIPELTIKMEHVSDDVDLDVLDALKPFLKR